LPNSQDTPEAEILVRLFGGDRQPLPASESTLIRIRDGNQQELIGDYFDGPETKFEVPFYDNLGDLYTVLASAKNRRDAGFYPVKVSLTLEQLVDLMLVPTGAQFVFATWDDLQRDHPQVYKFLCCAGDVADAKAHYEDLEKNSPPKLASLLNLSEAMRVIQLLTGTPLDYFKTINWDDSLAQDRFFGYADAGLVRQVKIAAAQGEFAPEPNPGLFHPDATSSYKQIQFGEANVQLTFHEKNAKNIGGVDCVLVEPDIDYYKDLGAHAILEVIANKLTHGLTDPSMVYVLRWIAGRRAAVAEFNPAYILA